MNRAQYRLLCAARRTLTQAKREADRLEVVNRDPDQQHDWDAWVKAEGRVMGLGRGMGWLNEFIKLGEEQNGKTHKKRNR